MSDNNEEKKDEAVKESSSTNRPNTEQSQSRGPYNRGERNDRGDHRGGDRGGRGGRPGGGRRGGKMFFKRKYCKFCAKKAVINFKDVDSLRRYVTEKGKIIPQRITGTCAKHQRELTRAIKRARTIALLPFVDMKK